MLNYSPKRRRDRFRSLTALGPSARGLFALRCRLRVTITPLKLQHRSSQRQIRNALRIWIELGELHIELCRARAEGEIDGERVEHLADGLRFGLA